MRLDCKHRQAHVVDFDVPEDCKLTTAGVRVPRTGHILQVLSGGATMTPSRKLRENASEKAVQLEARKPSARASTNCRIFFRKGRLPPFRTHCLPRLPPQ